MTPPDARSALVASGYDRIAGIYEQRFGASTTRDRWLARLIEGLPRTPARILDLGCGSGQPVAGRLVDLGHQVTGLDGSIEQVRRARRNVPGASFVHADMCEAAFDDASFDAVCAFYSITHLPAALQPLLIQRIASWLAPGGRLVASFGAGAQGEWTGEWLGTRMFFGHAGEEATMKALTEAGLRIERAIVEKQDNEDVAFLWIEAVKA